MSETNVTSSSSSEVESVLRSWAAAQAPARDFAQDRVFVFSQVVQHRDGVVFVPGELVLGHPAEGEIAEAAEKRGLPHPLAIWSFELQKEVVVPPGLLRLERRTPPPVPAPTTAAAK